MQINKQVILKVCLWGQENHGLFDYEAKDLQSISFVIQQSKYIVLKNNTVSLSDDPTDALAYIQLENGIFSFSKGQQDAYLKLSKDPKQLKSGDLFKLGRMEYFVSELFDQKQVIAPDHFNLDKHIQIIDGPHQCKFCYGDETPDPDNPYLSQLCKCTGHIQDVHYQCLLGWINSKINKHETYNTVMYEWDSALVCDVCKEPIPARVYVNDRQEPFHLINVERPPFPYIILEQITRQQNLSKSLTLVHYANETPISVGRGHYCEIRCQDISVSRSHAELAYEGQWYVMDKGSKFGTLQIINDAIIIEKEPIEIQIGRALLKLKLECL